MECRSPRCPSEQAEGSRFCEYHRDLFASIAVAIDDGKSIRRRSPERKRRTMFKECDWDGCPFCALPRESYCGAHLRMLARSLD